VLAIPSIEQEVKLLTDEITTALSPTNLATLNAGAISKLHHLGFSEKDAENIVSSISDQLPGWVLGFANNAVNATTTLLASILIVLFNTFLVIIISFYMMLDGDRLVERFVVKLPSTWQTDIRLFQNNVEQIFGGFFRAQLTVGAIYGVLTWITLIALGQANGLLAAVLAGAIMLIPFIGPFFAIIPPLLLVLLQTPTTGHLVLTLILLVGFQIAAQQIVLQLLAPRIVGTRMGIPRVLSVAELLMGAKAGGMWGACLAGPVAAVAYATAQGCYGRLRRTSPLFRAAEGPSTTSATAKPPSASPAKLS